jgi:hypothetical protein
MSGAEGKIPSAPHPTHTGYMAWEIGIHKKNTAKRNKKPLVYGTADMTFPY